MSSYIQSLIKKQVQEWFPNEEIKENYRPDWLIGLEIDLYLPNLNMAIEVDGLQHYFYTKCFHKCRADLEMQLVRDFIKRKILNNEQVKTCRVSHDYDSLHQLCLKTKSACQTKKLKINKEIETEIQNHWLENKDKFLQNLDSIEQNKLVLLDSQWNVCRKLIKHRLYKELYSYVKNNAYIQQTEINIKKFNVRLGPN